MGNFMSNVQPAVKKETKNVFLYTAIGTVLSWIAFFVLHLFFEEQVPFNYTVFLGGIGGLAVAVLNFFLMGLTVQKVAGEEDDKKASSIMKASFTRRMLLQGVWIIAAILAPCFQVVAGVLPLLFPSLGIKVKGIMDSKKIKRQEVEHE